MPARIGMRVVAVVSLGLVPLVVRGAVVDGASPPPVRSEPMTLASPRVARVEPTPAVFRAAAATPRVSAVQVRSSFESSLRAISRDIGLSVALPDGHDLWLFGDTATYQRTTGAPWSRTGFIDGSTALLARYAPGQVPHGGEVPGPKPARFVPAPTKVYMPDGSGRLCAKPTPRAAFPARWPNGAAVMPSNTARVLVTYTIVCVTHPPKGGPATRAEGWGYMLYNWQKHRIDRGPIDVIKPRTNGAELGPSKLFGWPVFGAGQLTLFSSRCAQQYVGCGGGQVWSVTLPATATALDKLASYKLKALSTDGSSPWEPMSISVGRYPSGLRLVEMTSISATYKVFSAASLTAPWHLDASGTLPGCTGPTGFCFALEGHPELSTATELFVSYKSPGSGPGGHIVVSALPD